MSMHVLISNQIGQKGLIKINLHYFNGYDKNLILFRICHLVAPRFILKLRS